MADPSSPWNEVGSQFSGLGQKLRYHFEQTRSAAAAEANEAEAEAAAAAQRADDEVRDALRKLADAIDNVVDAVGAAVKDPAVKSDVKNVGSSLSDAFAHSFASIGEDLRKAFRRNDDPNPPPTGTAPTSDA